MVGAFASHTIDQGLILGVRPHEHNIFVNPLVPAWMTYLPLIEPRKILVEERISIEIMDYLSPYIPRRETKSKDREFLLSATKQTIKQNIP